MNTVPETIVGYGTSSLSDVLPSVLAALGVAGSGNPLNVGPGDCIVVLLVDGLGWNQLREHADHAPFLSSLAARSLTVGFPTTTVVSITSLGTGVAPGEHGITGYTTRAFGLSEPVNWLTWRGTESGLDVTSEHSPEVVQPLATVFEQAQRAGVNATVVSAPAFRQSGLTRTAFRGAQYVAAFTAADAATMVAAAARERGGLIYCYSSELDVIGHVYGCHSESWCAQLELVDRGAQMIFDRLPAGSRLLVTADHGMVDVPESGKIDYDEEPMLREGVELLAGEARTRYLYVAPGELEAVRARWTQRLGDRVAMLTRDEAIARGWFGPIVTGTARERIGDLIALAVADVAVVRRRAESRSAALIGHHGSVTDAELLIPLLSS